MRDNGLTASSYTSMGGIDPLIAEPVLTALAEAGIAAYCGKPDETTPATEVPAKSSESDTESAEASSDSESAAVAEAPAPAKADEAVPARIPVGFDEIFVAADSEERARAVIGRSSEEAEWKSLVEQFNAPAAEGHDATPVPRWPASEDVDEGSYEPLIDVPAGLIVGDTDEEPPEEPPARRAEDHHEHFVPPEPPKGPKLDWISRAAWLGLIGGPLLLIAAALLDFGTGRITTIAVVGFIGGFLTLVIRMKDRLPPEDTPDDGAVV
ncbi:hypothetical protein [Streptomyces sp. SID13031]|uniref:hypothetical protein n=1 Tax=Streptomyces sp. SID13031 TaxID=2706046 RepID=UPI0013C86861|nr:hypothetical protein [Streptomyces sp. SID13031]NEA36639.1 hypothetical protein [Streptomyces sp. SID13031]